VQCQNCADDKQGDQRHVTYTPHTHTHTHTHTYTHLGRVSKRNCIRVAAQLKPLKDKFQRALWFSRSDQQRRQRKHMRALRWHCDLQRVAKVSNNSLHVRSPCRGKTEPKQRLPDLDCGGFAFKRGCEALN
jgi:hypothetical protein